LLSRRDSALDHEVHDIVGVDIFNLNVGMLVLKDPKNLIDEALPDSLDAFEVKNDVFKLLELKKHSSCLRTGIETFIT